MSTPEGKVKESIKAVLAQYKIYPASKAGSGPGGTGFPEDAQGWYTTPVKNAFGVSGIPDFHGHYRGIFWACEAKAKGKTPSGFQKLQIDAISCSGGAVFVVDGPESLKEFEKWLQKQDLLNHPSLGYLNRMYK